MELEAKYAQAADIIVGLEVALARAHKKHEVCNSEVKKVRIERDRAIKLCAKHRRRLMFLVAENVRMRSHILKLEEKLAAMSITIDTEIIKKHEEEYHEEFEKEFYEDNQEEYKQEAYSQGIYGESSQALQKNGGSSTHTIGAFSSQSSVNVSGGESSNVHANAFAHSSSSMKRGIYAGGHGEENVSSVGGQKHGSHVLTANEEKERRELSRKRSKRYRKMNSPDAKFRRTLTSRWGKSKKKQPKKPLRKNKKKRRGTDLDSEV